MGIPKAFIDWNGGSAVELNGFMYVLDTWQQSWKFCIEFPVLWPKWKRLDWESASFIWWRMRWFIWSETIYLFARWRKCYQYLRFRHEQLEYGKNTYKCLSFRETLELTQKVTILFQVKSSLPTSMDTQSTINIWWTIDFKGETYGIPHTRERWWIFIPSTGTWCEYLCYYFVLRHKLSILTRGFFGLSTIQINSPSVISVDRNLCTLKNEKCLEVLLQSPSVAQRKTNTE